MAISKNTTIGELLQTNPEVAPVSYTHLEFSRMVLGKPAREGESPVSERRVSKAGSRVPRDTRNLVGMSGDHPM